MNFFFTTCSPSLHESFYSSLYSNNAEGVRTVLDQVSWTEEASIALENLLNAKLSAICLDSKVYSSILQAACKLIDILRMGLL